MRITKFTASESKQVGNFHEKLTAVIDKRVACANQVAIRVKRKIVIQVLQVAVIAHIHGSSRVDEVRDKKIRIEILGGRQAGESGVSEYGGILHDDSGRELGRELIIPLGANDVVVEGSATVGEVTQTKPQICVVDSQVTGGNDAEVGGHAVATREIGIDAGWGCVVDAAPPAPVDVKDDLLVGRGAKKEELGIAMKIFILHEDGEISRAEKFGLVGVAESHTSLSRHLE